MRLIGQALINEIDEAGYLRADLAGVAERLGAPLDLVEETLAVIQTFEPAGVGARDLAECLAIQLRERDRFDPAMAALVANLDLVARRDHAALTPPLRRRRGGPRRDARRDARAQPEARQRLRRDARCSR